MRRRKQIEKLPSSFRDLSGFLFKKDNVLLRQVNNVYKKHYDLLLKKGLYEQLTKQKLLVSHEELDLKNALTDQAYKVLRPKPVPFISYPYEWCFGMLKDAALTTLKIQKTALAYDMSLKDASAYNIQFIRGHPILIDTLSFEKYKEGKPWVAYRQFCQHFLAPLALVVYKDFRLIKLLRIYIDGVPLDLAAKLLPKKTLLNTGLLSHLHLHAKTQKKYETKHQASSIKHQALSKKNLIALIDNLCNTVSALKWKTPITEWGDYYHQTNYSKKAFTHKKILVKKYIQELKPKTIWDLGANTGEFSRIASSNGSLAIAFDIDPLAVEKNYRRVVEKREKNILPLILDLYNPSPALGWAHKERASLIDRGPVDTVLALALVHHLAISNNLPFDNIAKFFAQIGRSLIVEFVPKNDSQVQKLLATREDIFTQYTQEYFEKIFSEFFTIQEKSNIVDSKRILYLLKNNQQ